MPYSAIVGHAQQISILTRARSQERLAHAYLFAGPAGVGKRQVALALSQSLLCREGTGCGHCPACQKVDSGNHPDLHLLDGRDGAIKIEHIRLVQQQLALRPLEGDYRICLIDGAEEMTPAAANALLKTLEEPLPDTLLVLISEQPEKLLPTILSRCQQLPFKRLPRPQLEKILQQELELENDQVAVLAALSDGSLNKALGRNNQLYLENRSELIQSLSALNTNSIIPVFAFAEDLAAQKELLPEILGIFQAFYRDILLLQLGRTERELVNLDLLEQLQEHSRTFSTDSLLRKLEALEAARYHLQRNVNRQLAMAVMLTRIAAA
jgi:DNA polymerase-3 subunit delta'